MIAKRVHIGRCTTEKHALYADNIEEVETGVVKTRVVDVAEITTSEAATGGTTMMLLVTTKKMTVRSFVTIIESQKNGIMSHL